MGSYRDETEHLPFITDAEWAVVKSSEEVAFRKWKGKGSEPGLRGIIAYDALMHTGFGFRILERNSRGGNTESINLFATLEDDPIEVCFRMIDGTLRGLRFKRKASVVTCVVPRQYGSPKNSKVPGGEIELNRAFALQKEHDDNLRVFPMDVRIENGRTVYGSSRSVAVVGIGENVEEARDFSLMGVRQVRGKLRHRKDIAAASDILRSCKHMNVLRAE